MTVAPAHSVRSPDPMYALAAPSPAIGSAAARQTFDDRARSLGLDPASRWVGGYVEYEWTHLCPLLEAYGVEVGGRRILELGCNVGASAIVMAWLGGDVQAIDISEPNVALARANACRYGEPGGELVRIGEGRAGFRCVPDTRSLPYPDAAFDLVTCNSVLEYVDPGQLAAVQREVDRVLAPGGVIVVTGTSSRLWPREVHSGRWLIHWLPRGLGRRLAGDGRLEQGVWPWVVRNGFGRRYTNLDQTDGGRAFLAGRAAMTPSRAGIGLRLVAATARSLGIGPGLMTNSVSCVLRKDG